MTKLILTMELDYPADLMHADDPDAIEWFFNDVLGDDQLILHSNLLGDEVGTVKIVKLPNALVKLNKRELKYLLYLMTLENVEPGMVGSGDVEHLEFRQRLKQKLFEYSQKGEQNES